MALESSNEFIVQDTFYIKGRGFVFYVIMPTELEAKLSTGDKIMFDDNESYIITGIERTRNSFGLSRRVGVLVSGDLKYEKSAYYDKKFKIAK
jgi:hypothetical protein